MQTTETTIQELLKPRYKVIAPWPEMERWLARVGDVLTDPGGHRAVTNQNGDAVPAFEWETFPHLFRKLEWHEERKPEEMPEYVKHSETGEIEKVHEWHNIGGKIFFVIGEYLKLGNTHWYNPDWFMPASLADYNSYISSTGKKEKV